MNQSNLRSIPVFLAFLCMGFGDAVGPFVGLAREHFHLSNFMATMIQFVGFLMFFVLSIPMGIYQDKRGKKHVLMIGLFVALVGLVIPIVGGLESYAVFLFTILLLGGGAAILQVAGNPIMRDVSPEGKYSRNLSLGQFVKAIGSLSGPVIPVVAARLFGAGWAVIFPIYSVALLITLIVLWFTRIDEEKTDSTNPATFKSSFRLLGNGYVAMMVIGIFIYVGAEQSMSSGIPLFLNDRFGIDIQEIGVAGTGPRRSPVRSPSHAIRRRPAAGGGREGLGDGSPGRHRHRRAAGIPRATVRDRPGHRQHRDRRLPVRPPHG